MVAEQYCYRASLKGRFMHIILLSRRHGAARSLTLNPRMLWMAAILFCVSSLACGMALGAWVGPQRAAAPADLSLLLDEQRAEVSNARKDAELQLQAFTVHLAEMQARLTRLDALGQRLTELADLDASEFDFSQPVGQGGPEEPLEDVVSTPPFMQTLEELAERLDSREQQLEVLEQILAERDLSQSQAISGRPVLQGYQSSFFGRRSDPLTGRPKMHKGVDFAARAGTPIVAVAAGVVTYSGSKSGYGNVVKLAHADGYVTVYAHNQRNLVKVGELVQRGQTIATVGSTGRSTGNHLHFEVRRHGRHVNPAAFIARAEAQN